MISPKKTKKGGEGGAKILTFPVHKTPSDWEKQHRNAGGSHCVLAQWIGPSGCVSCQLVTLSCRDPWPFPCPAMACCISPPFSPDAGCSGVPPTPALPLAPRIPPWPPTPRGHPVHLQQHPGTASAPSCSPAARPARPLWGAQRTTEVSSLTEGRNDCLPQQPPNYLVCSCLLLSSNG